MITLARFEFGDSVSRISRGMKLYARVIETFPLHSSVVLRIRVKIDWKKTHRESGVVIPSASKKVLRKSYEKSLSRVKPWSRERKEDFIDDPTNRRASFNRFNTTK
jgi:hypothetical protein